MPNAGQQDLLDDCCAQALRDLFGTLDEQGVVDIPPPPTSSAGASSNGAGASGVTGKPAATRAYPS